MKLIHKGLILISVPLAFAGFFSCGFASLLKQSTEQLKTEVCAKEVIARTELLQVLLSESSILVGLRRLDKGPEVIKHYDDIWVRIAKCYRSLEEIPGAHINKNTLRQCREVLNSMRRGQQLIWTDDGTLQALFAKQAGPNYWQVVSVQYHRWHAQQQANGPLAQLVHEQLSSVGNGKDMRAAMSAEFSKFLLFGVIGNLLIVAALSAFFGYSIESRLRNLMDTTRRLAKGEDLARPLHGADELAALDLILHDTAAQLIEFQRFKKQLLSVVCHELKAPLSQLQVTLYDLNAHRGALQAFGQEILDLAQQGCNRLQLMVSELLDLDVMASGTIKLSRVPTQSGHLAQTAVNVAQAVATDFKVVVSIKDSGLQAIVDPDRIVQVLVNLLSNAIKFSPPTGQVILEAKEAGDFLEFLISDEGPGIPDNLHESIFAVFHQGDQPKNDKIKGTGMGLAISKRIVEAHGGTISILSRQGPGCTFQVLIPKEPPLLQPDKLELDELRPSAVASPTAPSQIARGNFLERKLTQIGIRQKGLILIGLPLITEMLLVGMLAMLLNQANFELDRQSRSRAIAALSRETVQTIESSSMLILLRQSASDLPEVNQELEQKVQAQLAALQVACSTDPERKSITQSIATAYETLQRRQREIVRKSRKSIVTIEAAGTSFISGYLKSWEDLSQAVTQLVAHEELLEADANLTLTNVESNIDKVLIVGLAINVLIGLSLTLLLIRGLTDRIAVVRLNAERMLTKEPLKEPLLGSDEIAQLDRAFHDASRALSREQALKKQLVAIASHELRTPLSSILLTLQLLRSGSLGLLPLNACENIVQAENRIAGLAALINDILDIEKMDAGMLVLRSEDIDFRDLGDRAIACLEGLARDKEINLVNEISYSSIARGDQDRLVQVLVNLIVSASKFSHSGQTIRLSSSTDDVKQILVRVSGAQLQLLEEQKEKIFENYTSTYANEANQFGTGLGLSISKSIIEQHGGTIGFAADQSATPGFWFSIPISTAEDANSQ